MKHLIFLSLVLLLVCKSYGQYTYYSTSNQYYDGNTEEVTETSIKKQVFSISLPDQYLIHTVFKEDGDAVAESQIYMIISKKEVEDSKGSILTVKSGVTGNEYTYIFNFDGDTPVFAQYVDGDFINYVGELTTFKTYLQDEE